MITTWLCLIMILMKACQNKTLKPGVSVGNIYVKCLNIVKILTVEC